MPSGHQVVHNAVSIVLLALAGCQSESDGLPSRCNLSFSLPNMGCVPRRLVDYDPVREGIQDDCVGVLDADDRRVERCADGGVPCWRLQPDDACTTSPQRIRMQVILLDGGASFATVAICEVEDCY